MRLTHFSFEREARWLLVLSLVLPGIALLALGIVPAVMRWLGLR